MLTVTMCMVAQNLNHAALANTPVSAFFDHSLQLSTQRMQLLNAQLYLLEVTARNAVCI